MKSIINFINEKLILNNQSKLAETSLVNLYNNGNDIKYKNTTIIFDSPLKDIDNLSEEDRNVLLNTIEIILDNVNIPYIKVIESSKQKMIISCYNDHYGDNINYDKKVAKSYVCGLAIDKSSIRMKKSLSGIGVKYITNNFNYLDTNNPMNKFAIELEKFVQQKNKPFKWKEG